MDLWRLGGLALGVGQVSLLVVLLSGCAALKKPPAVTGPAGVSDPPGSLDVLKSPAEVRSALDEPWDALVREAVQASILGRPGRLEELGAQTEALCKDTQQRKRLLEKQGTPGLETHVVPEVEDQIRLLGVFATAPPLPTAKEAKSALAGTRLDPSTRAIIESLRGIEPRSRLRAARKVRRYETWTGPINATAQTFFRVIQGNLFSVVELVAGGMRSVVRYPYPTPRDREVLRAERDVLSLPAVYSGREDLDEQVSEGLERRRRLARLQALRIAEQEARAGRREQALWWYGRARTLDPEGLSRVSGAAEISREVNAELRRAEESLQVLSGEGEEGSLDEKILYGSLIRAYTESPRSVETASLRQEFLERFPESELAGEVRLTEVAAFRQENRLDASLTLAASISRVEKGSAAAARAGRLASAPEFVAAEDFARARRQERAEWWNYFLTGTVPLRPETLHLSEEEARVRLGNWTRFVTPLFVIDSAARLIQLPFGWPLDQEPTLDAVARWTPPPPDDARAAERQKYQARALEADHRFVEAARAYEELIPPDLKGISRCEEKAAAERWRRSRALQDSRLRARELERLVNAFPETRAAEKARTALQSIREGGHSIAEISKEELLSFPALRAIDALDLSSTLLDGNPENGELAATGVTLYADARLVYHHAEGWAEEVQLADGQFIRALERLTVLRRDSRLKEGLRESKRLYTIPFQVEGSAFPGLDVAPGFVPARPWEGDILYR